MLTFHRGTGIVNVVQHLVSSARTCFNQVSSNFIKLIFTWIDCKVLEIKKGKLHLTNVTFGSIFHLLDLGRPNGSL